MGGLRIVRAWKYKEKPVRSAILFPLLAVCAAAGPCLTFGAQPVAGPQRPNVVLIAVDNLGLHGLGWLWKSESCQ
jgi:hypothetical protein